MYIIIYMRLTSSAPLALQGALHHWSAGDVNGVSVSASCDKHPNQIPNFSNYGRTDM